MRALVVVCGLLAVAFGGGWLLGTTNQPAVDTNPKENPAPAQVPARPEQAQAQPQPAKQVEAKPQPAAQPAASDVRLASGTAPQPKPQVEPVPVTPEPPAQAQKPNAAEAQPRRVPEANQHPRNGVVSPPPIPREEEVPAVAAPAKPVIPIGTLANQKLARFEVSKPTPLTEVLRDLNELLAGRIEIADSVPIDELDQRITVVLSDTTALDALESVLKSTSLRAAIRGDRIVISKD